LHAVGGIAITRRQMFSLRKSNATREAQQGFYAGFL
jgi:hypothetical protein